MTVLAVASALALLFLCGFGVVWILVPRSQEWPRLALAPLFGLYAGTLFTMFLASLGWTGQTIARVTILFFLLLDAIVLWRKGFSRADWRISSGLLAMGAATVALVAWPLFASGIRDYYGAVNPDQAYYLQILDHLDGHSFGFPSKLVNLGTNPNQAAILGLSYFFPMTKLLTGIPITQLWSVIIAATVFAYPASVWMLARRLLGMEPRIAWVACAACSASSLLALAFHLQSLGAVTLIVTVPFACAVAAFCLTAPGWRTASTFALISIGAYYCYYPGMAVLGALSASIWGWNLVRGNAPATRLLLPVAAAVGAALLTFGSHGRLIFGRLLQETLSNRLAATDDDEILASFGLYATERFFNYALGFALPSELSVASIYFWPLFLLAIVLAILILCQVRKKSYDAVSALPPLLASAVLVLAFYIFRINGYGIFKLAAWFSPIFIVALAGSLLEYRFFHSRLALAVLAAFLSLNIAATVRWGRFTLPGNLAGGIKNLIFIDFPSFQELSVVDARWAREGILAALPDPVVQRWSAVFFQVPLKLLPTLPLNTQDSSPRSVLPEPDARYFLVWSEHYPDLQSSPGAPLVWRNRDFLLYSWPAIKNTLIPGLGWYRPETHFGGPAWQRNFRWLRKRAELLLIHPTPEPKQLMFTVVAGYGVGKESRQIDLLLNGRKIDEFHVLGYGSVQSKPFTAAGPINQLELVILETPSVVPRDGGLWNKQIPHDGRKLNIAVSSMRLADVASAKKEVLPYSFQGAEPDSFARTGVNGVYPDQWLAPRATVALGWRPGASLLRIRGFVPGVANDGKPFRLDLRFLGEPLAPVEMDRSGNFDLRVPLPSGICPKCEDGQPVEVELAPAASFNGKKSGRSTDPRDLSFQLHSIEIQR